MASGKTDLNTSKPAYGYAKQIIGVEKIIGHSISKIVTCVPAMAIHPHAIQDRECLPR